MILQICCTTLTGKVGAESTRSYLDLCMGSQTYRLGPEALQCSHPCFLTDQGTPADLPLGHDPALQVQLFSPHGLEDQVVLLGKADEARAFYEGPVG